MLDAMSLPETIRVKLSSEAAGAISITPVVVRDMPVRELVELMLGLTGKSGNRVHELLLRGALVSGASRFRWTGWDADRAGLEALLATFPSPDPGRAFVPDHCSSVLLRGATCRIEIPREVGARRRFLRRASLWDGLIEIASSDSPHYMDYSYKDRADCYRLDLSSAAAQLLRECATRTPYPTLEQQIRSAAVEALDLYTRRLDG